MKKDNRRGVLLAFLTIIAAAALLVMTNIGSPKGRMYGAVISCMFMLLFSGVDKKWKIAAACAIFIGIIIYLCIYSSVVVAKYGGSLKPNIVEYVYRNHMLKDLHIIGISFAGIGDTSIYTEPFGYFRFGILPALLLFTSFGVLVWRFIRSALHIRDRMGRIFAVGLSAFLVAQIVIGLLLKVITGGEFGIFIPFYDPAGSSIGLSAGLIGLVFGLYRRKDIYPAVA